MKIFFGADHRGFELKNKLATYAKTQGFEVHDMGNDHYDAQDDYPDFSQKVAHAVLQEPGALGVVICGSGIGVAMAANRFKGIRAALGFRIEQVRHGREHDHINVLALPSDYIDEQTGERMIDEFVKTEPVMEEKYTRRSGKLDA